MPSSLRNRAGYFLSCLAATICGTLQNCPSCGAKAGPVLDRKAWVTCMRRCQACHLLYRSPVTDPCQNPIFYEEHYEEGFTTDMPPLERLHEWIECGFSDTEKDYRHYVAVLQALGIPTGARVFDFGCSWGYGSHQLARAGFQVEAWEISRPRAQFAAQNLGVALRDPAHLATDSVDVFFSAHVIEHVPSVSAMIDLALRVLKPGGCFITFTPNGSDTFRNQAPRDWHLMWGQSHPQLIDEIFLQTAFPNRPLLLHSAPLLSFHQPGHLTPVRNWIPDHGLTTGCLDHVELLFVTHKPARAV